MKRKARVVKALQHLLDESGSMMPYSWISDEESGRSNDDLPANLDRVGTIEINGETITLTVEKLMDADSTPVWLFSSETIARVAAIEDYDRVLPVDQVLPEWSKEDRWGGVAIGQWLAIVALAIIAYLIAFLITTLVLFVIRKLWHKATTQPTSGVIRAFVLPVRLCIALSLLLTSGQEVGISIILRQRFSDVAVLVALGALLLLLWRLNNVVTDLTEKRLISRRQPSALSAVLFFRRVARIAIIAFGIICILAAIGIIENFAHRQKFRFFSVFGLRYETTPDQMRFVLVQIRSVLYAHPKVDPDPARIRFIELGPTSLNLEIFAYINARDFDDFLEIREDLFLRIMEVIDESGTRFAVPSQTLYLSRDKGLSEEKTRQAEENVRKWREKGEMQIPSFDAERINELRNSILYPPEGSHQQRNKQR
jgi:small-conductance mechanosensitive channel